MPPLRPGGWVRRVLGALAATAGTDRRRWEATAAGPAALLTSLRLVIARRRSTVIVWEASDLHFPQHFVPVLNELERKHPGAWIHVLAGLGSRATAIDPPRSSRLLRFPLESRRVPRADLYVSPSNFRTGPDRAYRVHLGHGLGAKFTRYPPAAFGHFHEWFVQGPVRMRFLRDSFEASGTSQQPEFSEIGYPASDPLVQANRTRPATSSGERSILFAPSWEAHSALRSDRWGLERVLDLLLGLGWASIRVRLHPISLTPRKHPKWAKFTGGIDWAARLRPYEGRPGFLGLDDPTRSNFSALVGADILVTDYSSIGLDFLLLDRPSIYLECGDAAFKSPDADVVSAASEAARADLASNAGRTCGTVVADADGFGPALEDARLRPDALSPARRAVASELLYNPGRGAEAAAARLLELASGAQGRAVRRSRPAA